MCHKDRQGWWGMVTPVTQAIRGQIRDGMRGWRVNYYGKEGWYEGLEGLLLRQREMIGGGVGFITMANRQRLNTILTDDNKDRN